MHELTAKGYVCDNAVSSFTKRLLRKRCMDCVKYQYNTTIREIQAKIGLVGVLLLILEIQQYYRS